jgi:phage/plasmid primase-like uncharacterized protein
VARYDLEEVRSAARGAWEHVHTRVAGIGDDFLNSKQHGPCPKCSGTDRWRCFNDYKETGGAICNQCGRFADGFAVVQWSLGCTFLDSVEKTAEFLGVKPTGNGKSKKGKASSEAIIEFLQWSEPLVAMWCHNKKKTIKARTVKQINAVVGRHKRMVTISLPILDEEGKTIGWTLYESSGGKLPVWNPKTKETTWLKVKTIKSK